MKRTHVLNSIKQMKVREESVMDWWRRGQSDSVRQLSVVNPCNEWILEKTVGILAKGPKHCVNIKPSRLDVFSSVQTIARLVNQDEKVSFVDQALGRMEKLMVQTYPKERRDFRNINMVKRELETRSLKLLQTDKSGRFGILPLHVFQKKTESAMDSLFSVWDGKLSKLRKNICTVFEG